MAANALDVQLLEDSGLTTVVKITGYFTGATTSNTTIIKANTLSFANTSKSSNVCSLTISKIQFAVDIVSGYAQLYWAGTSANTPIVSLGTSTSGVFDAYFPNNAAAPTGEIGIALVGAASGDSVNMILKINKEAGYANAFIEYNDNRYHGG